MIIELEDDIQVEQFLEHHGVKGQKWGIRNKSNRELNRASRAKDKKKQATQVDKARANIKSGTTKENYKKAKAQYKKDKVNLGSRKAKQILRKAREKKYTEIEKSNEYRNGKEAAAAVLLATGAYVGLTMLLGGSKRR